MSKLAQLREQRNLKAREANEINAKYAADVRMPAVDAEKLDAIVETYSHKMPRPLGRFVRWLRKPELRWLRLMAGILLVLLGFVGFLPILGFWMVPLSLIILAQDSKWLQRPTLRAISWLERKFAK